MIAQLGPGDEIVITENDNPIARLLPLEKRQPQFGSCQGMLTLVDEDDEHLKDFQDSVTRIWQMAANKNRPRRAK